MIKFQTLAIIFILFILPITLLLTYYINSQIDIIAIQNSYDTKLLNATYDAIIAFQLNTINNSGYSTNADPLRRDINASINTFKTSLANNFGVSGGGASYMLPYIPAVVYTLYDGYYIYAPIANTSVDEDGNSKTSYEHTLKPYIYYTARYKSGNSDFVVNYSLDNYVVIYGNVNGTYCSKAGYLTYLKKYEDANINLTNIDAEKYFNGDNDRKDYISTIEFSNWVTTNLGNIKAQDIVVEVDGNRIITAENLADNDTKNQYYEFKKDTRKIFEIDKKDNDPEVKTSDFYEHKYSVIRKSIESNLNSAINNYTKQSQGMGTTYDFKMPILSATEWDKVLSNVSIITFMQGLNIGFKTYNNYMIVSSTGNSLFVDPESLYFVTTEKTEDNKTIEVGQYYHRINCPLLAEELKENPSRSVEGYTSIDFKGIYTEKDENGLEINSYTYKHTSLACYECIVASKVGGIVYDNKEKDTTKDYTNDKNDNLITFVKKYNDTTYNQYNDTVVSKLRNAYYNALFKERKNLIKVSQYVNGAA